MTKIKFIKEIEILSCKFSVVWDKKTDGGSFSWADGKITVGVKSYSKDPLYTLQILSHEIMEIILVGMGARFENGRTKENYLFNFCHQTFENAIQIHTQALNKFLA
jgi:hypothetical protein